MAPLMPVPLLLGTPLHVNFVCEGVCFSLRQFAYVLHRYAREYKGPSTEEAKLCFEFLEESIRLTCRVLANPELNVRPGMASVLLPSRAGQIFFQLQAMLIEVEQIQQDTRSSVSDSTYVLRPALCDAILASSGRRFILRQVISELMCV